MFWLGWGYWRLLIAPVPGRWSLLRRFLRIDWHVLHGHSPTEITRISVAAFGARSDSGTWIEAGCWNGGSSAKFSLICQALGYRLHIFDSFQGVEDVSSVPGEWDYTGQYTAAEATVLENIRRYGCVEVCKTHPGWFAETMTAPVPGPVCVAYIDCDIAKGTSEALRGIVPSLAPNGLLFSQDYHIGPVRKLLQNPDTWRAMSMDCQISECGERLARLTLIPSSSAL